LEVNSKIIG